MQGSLDAHKFHLLMENVTDYAIFLVDHHRQIADWNLGAERVFGYTDEEITGKPFSVLFTTEDQAQSAPERECRTAEQTGRAADDRWHVRKGQERFWAYGSLTALRDESGQFQGFVKIVRDLTHRKQAEEARARDQAHIEVLYERLQRAMTETHHRVKNSLQVIASLMDMHLMEQPETLPIRELHRLSLQVRTLAVIHEVLTKQAKEEGEAHSVSAREVLERLTALLRQIGPERPILFRADDMLLTTSHATSLALIVNELVSNALKHGTGAIEVTLAVGSEAAGLEICDDGPGFPVDFNPKVAAHTGLELVETLARSDLHGEVHYKTRAEGGARVTVNIPLHPKGHGLCP